MRDIESRAYLVKMYSGKPLLDVPLRSINIDRVIYNGDLLPLYKSLSKDERENWGQYKMNIISLKGYDHRVHKVVEIYTISLTGYVTTPL